MPALPALPDLPAPAPLPPVQEPRRSSTPLFLAALVARTWLWFVAGCVVVTLLPLVLGWRPYVVESGSMQPRIDVGDVVLAAPESDPQTLLGRVAVFDDPSRPGTVKTHRVVAVNADGTLTTKGDANVGNDSAPVEMAAVHGLGRLLVMFAGLPMVWLHTGQWVLLGLFLLSLLVAGWLVGKDRDDDAADEDAGADGDGPGPDGGALLPLPHRLSGGGGTQVAAARPEPLRRVGQLWGASRALRRAAYASVLAVVLAVPTTAAAFASTTRSTANAWSVPNWDYTATIQSYSPYLYWKLDDTTGTTAVDSSGNGRTGTYTATTDFTRGIAGAFLTDTPNVGVTQTTATACINTTSTTAIAAPQVLTEIAWFRAPAGYAQGGKIMGWETPRTGVATVSPANGRYDRHVYMDGSGRIVFGVYSGALVTLASTATYNDDQWHMVAASLGPSGMALYVDGTLVASNATTSGENTQVWFRAGCGNLAGWGSIWNGGNNPGTSTSVTANRPFLGSLDEVSVHLSVLTAAQIRQAFISR